MVEEYNPFQSPELVPAAPAYPLPTSMRQSVAVPYASGEVRATFTMVLLAAVALCDVLGCWGCFSQNDLLGQLARGQRPAQAVLEQNDEMLRGVTIGDGIANVATTIAFLMWVHRAYRNLPALGAPKLEMTPGWAVGWYFVPFANLVKPCTAMSEIWRYSDPAQNDKIRKTTSALVGFWWASFLITRIVDRICAMNSLDERVQPTIESLKSVTNGAIVAFAIEFVASIVAIVLVYSVNKNQRAMHDLIVAGEQGSPAPLPYAY